MKRLTPRLLALAILVLGIGFGLRVFKIEARSLWYDEVFAVLFAEKGVSAMLYGTLTPVAGGAADIHPLLYYTMLNLWMQNAGQSVLAVRLWSVFWGMLCIALAYRIARELWDAKVGLWAALLVAVFPFHIHYSQETRMYTLLCALLLGAIVCFLRAMRPRERAQHTYGGFAALPLLRLFERFGVRREDLRLRWWIGFGVCAGLAMYTQQLAAFTLIALGLWVLSMRRAAVIVGMAIGTGIALVIYAPWLLQIPSQLQKINAYYWVAKPTGLTLFTSHYLFLTVYAELQPPLSFWALGGTVTLLIVAISLAFLLLRQARFRRERRGLLLVVWLWLWPMLLMWGFSQLSPVYLERALITSAVMLYIFLAWVLARGRGPLRLVMIACVVLQVGIGLSTQYVMPTFPYSPVREAMQCVTSQWQPGDRVVHHVKLSMLPAAYYARTLDQQYIGDEPGSAQDTLAVPTQEMLGLLAAPTLEVAVGDASRVWFVVYTRTERELAAMGADDLVVMHAALTARYGHPKLLTFSDLNVYAYGAEIRECE